FQRFLSPAFLVPIRLELEKLEKRGADHKQLTALNETLTRCEAVQRCAAWRPIIAAVPPDICFELWFFLSTVRGGYERGRKMMRRLTDNSAKELAGQLRAKIRTSDGTPGLTQAERTAAVSLLEKVQTGGRAELSKYGEAMPVRISKNPTLGFAIR